MPVFLTLAALFVLVPLTEIFLLLKLSSLVGLWTTLGIVLLTGFAGATLAKWQGARAWRAVRVSMRAGRMPSNELFDGFCILCAGLLMLTPGLLTDCAGFLLLIPPFRVSVRKSLAKRLIGQAAGSQHGFSFTVGDVGRETGTRPPAESGSDVIDVEGERVDE